VAARRTGVPDKRRNSVRSSGGGACGIAAASNPGHGVAVEPFPRPRWLGARSGHHGYSPTYGWRRTSPELN
jgi:hypothetical protein